MKERRVESLASRFHVSWLVQLVIVALFVLWVANGLLHLGG